MINNFNIIYLNKNFKLIPKKYFFYKILKEICLFFSIKRIICIIILDSKKMISLNKKYNYRNYITDTLSFSYS